MYKEFLWGVSISGFQFEMGDPNGLDIDSNTDWFVWVHDKYNIENKVVSGDFPENGPNYWFLFAKDHELAQKLGMNAFRIGIEWSRIFPKSTRKVEVEYEIDELGLISHIDIGEEHLFELDKIANKRALLKYREIIYDLRKREFKVIVNLNHFTLPLWIHNPIKARETKLKIGPLGWLEKESIVEFVKYVAYIAWKLGDIVDIWSVFNEPNIVARSYLFPSGSPPGVISQKAYAKAIINMAVAHARAYDMIKKFDKIRADKDSVEAAFVGLIHSISPAYPLNPENSDDTVAAKNFNYFYNEWFINAVNDGEVDIDFNGEIDSKERIFHMYSKMDWLGINYYTRYVLRKKEKPLMSMLPITKFEIVKGYGRMCKPNSRSKAGFPTSDFGWEIFPKGLYDSVRICAKYGKPILITENGIADKDDKLRPSFIVSHVFQLQEIKKRFNIIGYLHWSLIDNYEWASGFKMRFGLIKVDFENKKRIHRKSALIYKEIAENDGITSRLANKYLLENLDSH